MPDEKKNFVVEMLHNATGMDREKIKRNSSSIITMPTIIFCSFMC